MTLEKLLKTLPFDPKKYLKNRDFMVLQNNILNYYFKLL